MIRATVFMTGLMLSIIHLLPAQESFSWVSTGGGLLEDAGNDVAIGPKGSVYVTGYVFGNADLAGQSLFDTQSNEMFLAKFSNDGQVEWIKQAGGGDGSEKGLSVDVANDGTVYVAGELTNMATFGDTTSQDTSLLISNGQKDAFIASYTSSGELRWAKQYGGADNDQGTHVATTSDGKVYFTGTFRDSLRICDTTFNSSGSSDLFLIKYHHDGTCIWVEQAGGPKEDISEEVVADDQGNAYITGSFASNAVFGRISLNAPSRSTDVFTAKYRADGSCKWAVNEGGKLGDVGKGLALDQQGNVYVTGYFIGDVVIDGVRLPWVGYNDIFLLKYDSTGTFRWVRHAGGPNLDIGNDVDTDADGNVYMTGFYHTEAEFGQQEVTGIDNYEIFTAKYSSAGQLKWTKTAAGINGDFGKAIAVQDDGTSYITGWYFYKLSLGDKQLTDGNDADIYIANMAKHPTSTPVGQSTEHTLQVYPNPAVNQINMRVQRNLVHSKYGQLHLTLTDLGGQTILNRQINHRNKPIYNSTLDVSGLEQGIYLVILTDGHRTIGARKLTILR